MAKTNRKGRSKGSAKHIRCYREMFLSTAFQSLTPAERSVWMVLQSKYNGANNGDVGLGAREAATLANVSPMTASRALGVLQAKGFCRLAQDSSFNMKSRTSRRWTLTDHPTEQSVSTNEWRKWKPGIDLRNSDNSTTGDTDSTMRDTVVPFATPKVGLTVP